MVRFYFISSRGVLICILNRNRIRDKQTDRVTWLDSTEITATKQEEGEKVVNIDQGKERLGVMKSWVWIVCLIVITIVILPISVYLIGQY